MRDVTLPEVLHGQPLYSSSGAPWRIMRAFTHRDMFIVYVMDATNHRVYRAEWQGDWCDVSGKIPSNVLEALTPVSDTRGDYSVEEVAFARLCAPVAKSRAELAQALGRTSPSAGNLLTGARFKARWSQSDLADLWSMVGEGKSDLEIAEWLGRTRASVRSKRCEMERAS